MNPEVEKALLILLPFLAAGGAVGIATDIIRERKKREWFLPTARDVNILRHLVLEANDILSVWGEKTPEGEECLLLEIPEASVQSILIKSELEKSLLSVTIVRQDSLLHLVFPDEATSVTGVDSVSEVLRKSPIKVTGPGKYKYVRLEDIRQTLPLLRSIRTRPQPISP